MKMNLFALLVLSWIHCGCLAQDVEPAWSSAGSNGGGFEVFHRPRDGARMVWIPEGVFRMNRYQGTWTDTPQSREIRVDGFLIDETEVTNAQFLEFVRQVGAEDDKGRVLVRPVENGLAVREGVWSCELGDRSLPALGVTGWGALAYARWVGGDLPRLDEWQKAAGGTEGLIYPWGAEHPTPAHANYLVEGAARRPLPVGSCPAGASPYGILDMAGNVYERVWTTRSGSRAPVMIRGASWASPSHLNLRTFDLCMQPMDVSDRTVGFRVVIRRRPELQRTDAASPALRLSRSWSRARDEARARNVPILALLHFDTCGQCDRTRVGYLADPDFVRYVNENAVVVVGQDPGDAELKPHMPDPQGRCPLWPGMTCITHMTNFSVLRSLVGGFRVSPGQFILDPRVDDSRPVTERILIGEMRLPKWGGGTETFLEALQEAQRRMGEGVPRSRWKEPR